MWKIITGGAMMLASLAFGFFIRFTNADLTETKLFLDFWWCWTLIAVVTGTGYALMTSWRRKK